MEKEIELNTKIELFTVKEWFPWPSSFKIEHMNEIGLKEMLLMSLERMADSYDKIKKYEDIISTIEGGSLKEEFQKVFDFYE